MNEFDTNKLDPFNFVWQFYIPLRYYLDKKNKKKKKERKLFLSKQQYEVCERLRGFIFPFSGPSVSLPVYLSFPNFFFVLSFYSLNFVFNLIISENLLMKLICG